MGYHVFALIVASKEGGVDFLLEDLLKNKLAEGLERESAVNHCSGDVTVYLKVKNKQKFLRHFNRKWKENSDPVAFVLGKPTYLGYKNGSVKSNSKMKEVRTFIKGAEHKKR